MKGALPGRKKQEAPDPPRRLTTVWGESLDPEHVRDEYPRPRLVRAGHTMLNGYWDYAITKSSERPARFDGKILVPFSPESPLSGVGRQLQPEEYLWYERRVSAPDLCAGDRLLLHFEAVDQCAVVYVNGAEVRRHTGGYLPFTADISPYLTEPCSRALCGRIREEKSAEAVSPMRSASDAAASDDDYDDKASALSSNLSRDSGLGAKTFHSSDGAGESAADASSGHNNDFILTVRVQDFTDTSFHSRGKQKLQPGGMYYTAQSGIWQSVWMEIVPEEYIEDVLFEPLSDLTGVRASVSVHSPGSKDTGGVASCAGASAEGGARTAGEGACGADAGLHPVHVRVYEPTDAYEAGVPRGNVILEREFSSRRFSLSIPEPKLWSPQSPWLYPVEIQMGKDRVESYCAVRKFAVEKNGTGVPQILLNGTTVFLNGLLDQGYWPDGLYTAPADEAYVYDIAQMKALGFNMLRKHAKIECRRWYYHCDRLGMIVWQDMVNGGGNYSALLLTYLPTGLCVPGPLKKREEQEAAEPTLAGRLEYRITGRRDAEGREEFRRECAETVRLLRGYPCIMTWVLFNEGWGQFETKALTEYVRQMDPEHLIDSASGWFEHKTGDFKSVHNYFRKLDVPKDVRVNVLSEYGGYVYHIDEHSVYRKTYGYHTCTSAEEFEESFLKLMTQDVLPLADRGLCGAVYTQVSDIEEETNGLLTYDRRVRKISEDGARKLRRETAAVSQRAAASGTG